VTVKYEPPGNSRQQPADHQLPTHAAQCGGDPQPGAADNWELSDTSDSEDDRSAGPQKSVVPTETSKWAAGRRTQPPVAYAAEATSRFHTRLSKPRVTRKRRLQAARPSISPTTTAAQRSLPATQQARWLKQQDIEWELVEVLMKQSWMAKTDAEPEPVFKCHWVNHNTGEVRIQNDTLKTICRQPAFHHFEGQMQPDRAWTQLAYRQGYYEVALPPRVCPRGMQARE